MKKKQNASIADPASAAARQQNEYGRRILVVDDEDDDRQLLIDVLAFSGYEVQAVKDGAAGWVALQTHDFDLIVTDNKMPRVTGLEMIEKLRSATMTVPVIMATRHLPVDEFARRPWLKPDATLERPFSSEELLMTVNEVLGTDDGGDDQKESLLPKYL